MKNMIVILVAVMAVTTGVFAQNSNTPQIAASQTQNVLYLGIENPLSISVSDFPDETLSVTISQGTLSKVSEKEYLARPTNLGEATVSVFAEIDGEKQNIGSMVFSVKSLPTPVAKVGDRTGGSIVKDDFLSQRGVVANLENFPINLRYTVTQFDMVILTPQGDRIVRSNSPIFTDEQKALINSSDVGQRVFITNIKGRGPNGVIDLADLTFTIE